MDIDITGGRIFYTFPIDFPVLGKFQITETLLVLAGDDPDHRSLHLVHP